MTVPTSFQRLLHFTPHKAWKQIKTGFWSTDSILLLIRPAGAPVDPFPSRPSAGKLRLVTEEDLPDCAAFEDPTVYVPIYREMLRQGDLIYFGYLNGKCVYRHVATSSQNVCFAGHIVHHLGEREMMTHYSLCTPAARGGGWQTESLREFFHSRFDYTSYTLISEYNYASLISAFRAGYCPHSRLTVKKRIFFHSTLLDTPLSSAEVEDLMKLVCH